MEAITLILIVLILGVIAFFLTKNKPTKNKEVKKSEIIQDYENQMTELLLKYQNDKKVQLSEKTKLLKQINSELNRNIFFDEQEAREIIQNLLKL